MSDLKKGLMWHIFFCRVRDVLQEALIELNEDLSEHVESDDSDVDGLG